MVSLMEFLKKLFGKKDNEASDSQSEAVDQLKKIETSRIFVETEEMEKTPSSVIAIDTENKTVIIRTPQGFLADCNEEVEVFSYGISPKKFKTKVLAVRNGYLVLSIPLYIEDAQRRKHYRVDVKKENIEANLIVFGKKRFSVVPVDISIGGAQLEIRGKLMLAKDSLVTLCLELGDDPLMPIHMFVTSTTMDIENTTTLRGSFYDVKPDQERTLGKFLLDVQRKNRK